MVLKRNKRSKNIPKKICKTKKIFEASKEFEILFMPKKENKCLDQIKFAYKMMQHYFSLTKNQ